MKKIKGVSIVEALVVVFLMSIILVTFYSVFSLGTKHVVDSKNRLGAIALANEKMEIVRNLDYEDIGTKKDNGDGTYSYGIPAGDILEEEEVEKSGKTYYVETFVQYVDDSWDGTLGGDPNDDIPNDYKKVSIRVGWEDKNDIHNEVFLVSSFVPDGIENDIGGGILSINVIDSQGSAVSQASVNVVNSDEDIDVTTLTDSTGNVIFVGAPAGTQNYAIYVSKSDYYSVQTYPPYPTSSFYPNDVHVSVEEGGLTTKALITDVASDLKIVFKNPFSENISGIDFNLYGGRDIGNLPDAESTVVYDYDEDLTSNSSGEVNISDISEGTYELNLTSEEQENYYVFENSEEQTQEIEISLPPDTDLEEEITLADRSVNSLVVIARNGDDNSPIAGASIELSNSDLGYFASIETNDSGMVFFPSELPELEQDTYDIKITASGYSEHNGTTEEISGLEIYQVELNPN